MNRAEFANENLKGQRTAYICSPYRGDVERNVAYAKALAARAIKLGYAPIVPHLYIPQILDENSEADRALGLALALALLRKSDLVIVGTLYGISPGMDGELREACRLCIPTTYYKDLDELRLYT